jgi:hypothetical protein
VGPSPLVEQGDQGRVKWHTDIIGTTDFFLRELGEGLPRALSVLLRLALLWLFFWYLYAFSSLLWCWSWPFVVLAWATICLLLGWRLFRAAREFDLDKAPRSSGLPAYFCLALVPIVIVVLLESLNYEFPKSGLLNFTHLLARSLMGKH